MPGTTQVETTGLSATGVQVGGLADQVAAAAAGAGAVEQAGAASQEPALAAGAEAFATQWGQALTALHVSTEQLAGAVSASAPAYEMTDSQGPLSRAG